MILTGNLLALDLATNTGWCCGSSKSKPRIGSVRLEGNGIGERGCHLIDWMDDHVSVFNPQMIVFEAPLPRGLHSGINAGRIALGLAMAVEMFCYRRAIPCHEGNVNAARKAVLGKGNAKKPDCMAFCRAAGLDPPDEDASDAWVLWRYGIIERAAKG